MSRDFLVGNEVAPFGAQDLRNVSIESKASSFFSLLDLRRYVSQPWCNVDKT